jgi:hypothetical protein
MRQPSLSWLYRLECDIAKEEIKIGAPHNSGTIRSIANIVRGSVKGPGIEGEILPLGGADWATVVKGTHVSSRSSLPVLLHSKLTSSIR